MPEFVCPDCQAEIERDLIEKTGKTDCPFCGADLSASGLPESAELDAAGSAGDLGPLDRSVPNTSGESTRPVSAVPDKSRIKVVESTPDRLVLFIPGGGKQSSGLGCFALAWNGFMGLFTPLMTAGILKDGGGNAPPLLFIIPFLGVFWAIGLGFAWFWLKFKYERTFVLLDRDRIAIQRTLFNWKRLHETPLGPDSRASLVESYQQNDVPVYRVEVRGMADVAKFGTALGNEEKDWLVDRINDFLGVSSSSDDDDADEDEDDPDAPPESASRSVTLVFPNDCEKCGAPLDGQIEHGILTCAHCRSVHRGTVASSPARPSSTRSAERYDRLTPESLPQESGIRIVESSPERLAFRLRLASNSPLRWVVPLFTLPFAIGWYSFVVFFAVNMMQARMGWFGIIPLLFLIPFVAAGLMPLGIGMYAIAGNTLVTVTRERVSCRWGVGPFGYSRHITTGMIDSVRVEDVSSQRQNRRVRETGVHVQNSRVGIGDSRTCIVRAAGKMLPLTVLEDVVCARQVASLVRTKLEELGHRLTDA